MKHGKRFVSMLVALVMAAILLCGCDGQLLDRKTVLINDEAGIQVTFLKDRTHTSTDGKTLYIVLDIQDTDIHSKVVVAKRAEVNGVEVPVNSYTITDGTLWSDPARTWITIEEKDLKEKGIDIKDVSEVKTHFMVRREFGEKDWKETSTVTIKL